MMEGRISNINIKETADLLYHFRKKNYGTR
jgi:hypothetical protein